MSVRLSLGRNRIRSVVKQLYESMNEHVLFLHNKDVSATNNVAERYGREHTRTSAAPMRFRGGETHEDFCTGLSMLKTHTLRGDNLFDYVSKAFTEEEPYPFCGSHCKPAERHKHGKGGVMLIWI